MKGFFHVKKEDNKRGNTCASCGLNKGALNPKFEPYGNFKKEILLVADAPTVMDDKKGRPWTGTSGRLLKKTLAKYGVNIYEDCVTVYAVRCHPGRVKGKTKGIKKKHISACRSKLKKDILKYRPKVILLFGQTAVESVIGEKWKKDLGKMDKWRGWAIPDIQYHAWVCPIYKPSLIIQQEKFPQFETIWKQDIQNALAHLNKSVPNYSNVNESVEICTTDSEITAGLEWVKKQKSFAWDIESTGLKPHNTKNHKIVCTAFATNKRAIVVPKLTKQKHIDLYKDVLENQSKKIAHNMKFEHTWVHNIYGITVKNWWFDTMLGSHQLDSRTGVTGLKFQTLANFGIYDYDGDVNYLLKSEDEKDSNSTNKLVDIEEDPINYKKVMIYCGMDALLTFKLYRKQIKQVWK